MTTHNILFIDNQTMVADTLATLLPEHFVTVATNSEDALRLLAEMKFDYAFVEIALGSESGIALIKPLLSARIKPIMISGVASLGQIRACIRLGAYGYVDKCLDTGHFLDIFTKVKMGGVAFPQNFVDELRQNPALDIPKLTSGEMRLLDYFIFHSDQTNFELAEKLCLSEGRIRNMMTSLMRKFKAKGRFNLIKEVGLRGYFPGINTTKFNH